MESPTKHEGRGLTGHSIDVLDGRNDDRTTRYQQRDLVTLRSGSPAERRRCRLRKMVPDSANTQLTQRLWIRQPRRSRSTGRTGRVRFVLAWRT
jgi:hypothetical protein